MYKVHLMVTFKVFHLNSFSGLIDILLTDREITDKTYFNNRAGCKEKPRKTSSVFPHTELLFGAKAAKVAQSAHPLKSS